MILDLIVILLVIILSSLFCLNDKSNKSNNYCNLSHIVIGLTVIVFYKLVKYYKIKQDIKKKITTTNSNTTNNNTISTEKFTVDQSLNDFISNTTDQVIIQDQTTLSDKTIKAYTDTINSLTTEIKKLNESNLKASDQSNSGYNQTNNIDTISLENQQTLQEIQLNYLSNQIKNAQDIINQNTVSSNALNYKPIKLYSSCVANANGTTSTELPVKDNFINNSLNPLQSVLNSNQGQHILNTSSQTSQKSPSNIDLPALFNKLLSK